jgi:acetone carboxylase gamma subunit
MNERMLELARQVWPDPNISHANHMKFAELIIQECANYIRENYDSWDAEPLAHNMEVDFGLHGDYAE